MYLTYWGLKKNPFDSVPDPGMYFSDHSTVENTVAELLFAIEEGNDCLAVVVGEAGLGKTMTLRVVLNEVDPARYRIAFVTNPDVTFAQLLREIIGQLQGEPCAVRDRDALLEEFNRLLFETTDSGRKVLIFIDEGNAMSGTCLEGLRLLTNMQEDSRNLMTIILAGQPRLSRMLEDSRRANLFQRIGVYSRLEPFNSPEQVQDYISHRLTKAGASKPIFDDSAIGALHETCCGVPRLVNRVCKLSLKAGETNGLHLIDETLVRAVAARFGQERRKRRTDGKTLAKQDAQPEVPGLSNRSANVAPAAGVATEPGPVAAPASRPRPVASGKKTSGKPRIPEVEALPAPPPPEAPSPTLPQPLTGDQTAAATNEAPPLPLTPPTVRAFDSSILTPHPNPPNGANGHGNGNGKSIVVAPPPPPGASLDLNNRVPKEIVDALGAISDERQRVRLAGQFAAKQIQDHPEIFGHASIDPVKAWDDLRAEILRQVC